MTFWPKELVTTAHLSDEELLADPWARTYLLDPEAPGPRSSAETYPQWSHAQDVWLALAGRRWLIVPRRGAVVRSWAGDAALSRALLLYGPP